MRIARTVALLAASLGAAADRDPAKLIERVQIQVARNDATLPNYTCVQTVTRDYYVAHTHEQSPCGAALDPGPTLASPLVLTMTDRLRLDVTMSEHGELYSWAGASKFEDEGLDQVVRSGPIGTGSFGAMLAVVFSQDRKNIRYLGETTRDGHSYMQYLFSVPQERSRYRVKASNGWIYVAFSGSIEVDPVTEQVARLTVRTAALPPETGSCQTTTTMDFARVRIGDGEFLLPKEGRQRFIDRNGEEVENRSTLAACREYLGQSTISYATEPEPGVPGARKRAQAPTSIPGGLSLMLELTAPIAADTAAGGDRFTARLAMELRDAKGKRLAPAHARVEGRLLRVEFRRRAPFAALFVLQPRTIEIAGVDVPIAAKRDWRRNPNYSRGQAEILLPDPGEANAGVFRIPGEHAAMKAGTRSDWVTAVE